MSERQRSIARIVALQGRMKRLAEARLAGAEADKAAVVAKRDALHAYIDGANLGGPLAMLAVRNTRALSAAEAAAEARRLALLKVRQHVEARLKLAERVGEAVAKDEAAARERRSLERLIEEAVARDEVTGPRG